MTLKPWTEIAVPHTDVLKGTFQDAEFAADLSRVHQGGAGPEYGDPMRFFERTFITEGMRLLLDGVIRRLDGRGGDPVVQLQTAFGGGKTHTLLAVYHLAAGRANPADLRGVSKILDDAGITEPPKANIAVIDGNRLAPSQPKKQGELTINCLWGEIAFQLGGEAGYRMVADSDARGTSPGKEILISLLSQCAPCVLLMDELVSYFRQFQEGQTYSGGTFDSNISFINALTEAMTAVPRAVLLASLPESDTEVGSIQGKKSLAALEKFFGRVQALWKPVGTEEAFEIVRRRLFNPISDTQSMEAVCRSFAEMYAGQADDFPIETHESDYLRRLRNSYPIHPEIFKRLYEDWSSLEGFQRTRGVLKLMAKVIYRLWKDGNRDLMIMPGSLPYYDANVKNNSIYYLPQGWDPVMDKDIDGENAQTTAIDTQDPRLGKIQAARRVARTIFLGSAPSVGSQMVRGIDGKRINLGAVSPGMPVSTVRDALSRLSDRLHYLNSGDGRFWFDVRPNLRREMEERKRRFENRANEVNPEIRAAYRGIGLIDNHRHRTELAQNGENSLDVRFGLPHVLASEVADGDAGDSDRARITSGKKGFPDTDRAADQIAHGNRVELALPNQLRVVRQAGLGRRVPGHHLQGMARLNEFDQAGALRLDQVFLQIGNAPIPGGIQWLRPGWLGNGSLLRLFRQQAHQVVEVGQRQPRAQLGQARGLVRQGGKNRFDELLPFFDGRHGNLDFPGVRALHQNRMQQPQAFDHQHEDQIHPPHHGTARPVQQRRQMLGLSVPRRADQVRVIEQDRDFLGAAFLADENQGQKPVYGSKRLSGIPRQIDRAAQNVIQMGFHAGEPAGVRAGVGPQAASDVIVKNEVVAAEHPVREKIGQADNVVLSPLGISHRVHHVAMEDEEAGAAGQIGILKLPDPAGTVCIGHESAPLSFPRSETGAPVPETTRE